jgi:DNA-binding HxlR family transcriptional regulator
LIVKPNMTALGVAIEAVSDRWSLTIVRHLAFGPLRFTDLVRLTSAPRDVLTARLRALQVDGVVERRPYGTGKRERYHLTGKGIDLAEVVLVLKKWGPVPPERGRGGGAPPHHVRPAVRGRAALRGVR